MELHQLRYFICVAEHESMSKAALDLHVSQPALSKSIAKLESELKVSLFDRLGGRFTLTDSGCLFKQYAEQSISLLEDGICATKRMENDKQSSLD